MAMRLPGQRIVLLIAAIALVAGAVLERVVAADATPTPVQPAVVDDAQKLADRIDQLIAERWKKEKITPAPLATDDEFFRRASLDLCGRIPPGSEVRDFLANASPAKRRA